MGEEGGGGFSLRCVIAPCIIPDPKVRARFLFKSRVTGLIKRDIDIFGIQKIITTPPSGKRENIREHYSHPAPPM